MPRSNVQMIQRAAEVGGHVVWEKVRTPRFVNGSGVPASRKSVTEEWLTSALCGGHPGAAVTGFRAEDVSSGTSERWRIRVTYNEAGAEAGLPTAVFAKTTLKYSQRMMFGLFGIIANEPEFYVHLRPHIDIETPIGYLGAVDRRSWRSIALIEDISASKGATFCTPATPVTREDMEDLLANLAALHGRFWESDELDKLSVLKRPIDRLHDLEGFSYKKRAMVGIDRTRSVTPRALLGRGEEVYAALRRMMEVASTGPRTLLHGDSHIGNTYRTGAGRMGLADWQGTLQGRWAYDVAYTIGSGLAVEDRREWERDLLAFYLERLARAGGETSVFEEAWHSYRQHLIYPYITWAFTIGRGPLQPKMQPDEISRRIVERMANAIVDNDSLETV